MTRGYQLIEILELSDVVAHPQSRAVAIALLQWIIDGVVDTLGERLAGVEFDVVMAQSHGVPVGYPTIGAHYGIERDDVAPLVLATARDMLKHRSCADFVAFVARRMVDATSERIDQWPLIKQRFPVGTRVHGTVVRVEPFGVFVALHDSDAVAVLLVTHFEDGERSFALREYPQVGMTVHGVVIDQAEHNQQIRISTRRSDLQRGYVCQSVEHDAVALAWLEANGYSVHALGANHWVARSATAEHHGSSPLVLVGLCGVLADRGEAWQTREGEPDLDAMILRGEPT